MCTNCYGNGLDEHFLMHTPGTACAFHNATDLGLIGKKIEIRGIRANFMRLLTVLEDCDEQDAPIKIWLDSGEECKCMEQ